MANKTKYWINPRRRGWVVVCHRSDHSFYGLTEHPFGMAWTPNYCKIYTDYKRAVENADRSRRGREKGSLDDIFVARINSKNCPFEFNFTRRAPGFVNGNAYFDLREKG